MLGFKVLFLIGSLFASCHAFWWGARDSSNVAETPAASTPIRQFPISYIRAFAYQPMAFPQPLAPITTYQVSRNPQSFKPNSNLQPNANLQAKEIGNALAQAFSQRFLQDGPSGVFPGGQPSVQQQLPQNPQVEFGTIPTTPAPTTTTSTTTAAPVTTPPTSFAGSQPISQAFNRNGFGDGGYQRQLSLQQQYQSGNFGGFPQYYNEPSFNQQFNPYQFNERPSGNQFSGRVFGAEPSYQHYQADPMTYQFIPTSITPLPNIQNNVKFVPCMCPVAVQISPQMPEKRSDEIPLLNPTTESESLSPSSLSSPTLQINEDRK